MVGFFWKGNKRGRPPRKKFPRRNDACSSRQGDGGRGRRRHWRIARTGTNYAHTHTQGEDSSPCLIYASREMFKCPPPPTPSFPYDPPSEIILRLRERERKRGGTKIRPNKKKVPKKIRGRNGLIGTREKVSRTGASNLQI